MFVNCYGPKKKKTLSTRTNRVNKPKIKGKLGLGMWTSWSSTTSLKEGQDLCACKTKHIIEIGCGLVGQRLTCLERKKERKKTSKQTTEKVRRGKGRLELLEVMGMGSLGRRK